MTFSVDIISYLEEALKSGCLAFPQIFSLIKDNYPKEDCSLCFKYILENKDNVELLSRTIKEINSSKYKENLPLLIDFIFRGGIDDSAKVLAIKTISNYKDTSAVSALLYCLNDKNSNYKIRLAAAEALGKIGDKNSFEALGNIVCDEKEKSAYVKESAVIALGMLGDSRALDVFTTIMSGKQMFLDKFSYLKERVVEAMSKFDISKDARALDVLKKSLLEPSSRLRISAIETIMNSDIEGAFNLIYERLLYDDDLEVKKNALAALYNISDRRILDEVLSGNFSQELKDYALEIINECEDDE